MLCLDHPSWGCARLSQQLEREGIHVSSPTVQRILILRKLGRRQQRAALLERLVSEGGRTVNGEQTREIARFNPLFRDRRTCVQHPGELVTQQCLAIARTQASTLNLQLIVDSYSYFCHAHLHLGFTASAAVEVLRHNVLPDYEARGVRIRTLLTNRTSQYCGGDSHPFAGLLAAHCIEHRYSDGRNEVPSGPAAQIRARLQGTLLPQLANRCSIECAALQPELDAWVRQNNCRRIRDDPRVAGLRPVDLFTRGNSGP